MLHHSKYLASQAVGDAGLLLMSSAYCYAGPISTDSLQYVFAATSARAYMQAVELGDGLQGVQQSKLAEAFGPEGEELQGNEGTPGKAERVQIGDALVALLESHRKHRFSPQRPVCEHALICSALSVYYTVLVLPFGVLCPRGPVPGALQVSQHHRICASV